MKTTVVNCNSGATYDIFIGRPSIFGNPFIIGKDGTRAEVIQKYRDWIFTQPNLLLKIKELQGKVLGCYCYPKDCHGDVLIEIVDSEFE